MLTNLEQVALYSYLGAIGDTPTIKQLHWGGGGALRKAPHEYHLQFICLSQPSYNFSMQGLWKFSMEHNLTIRH